MKKIVLCLLMACPANGWAGWYYDYNSPKNPLESLQRQNEDDNQRRNEETRRWLEDSMERQRQADALREASRQWQMEQRREQLERQNRQNGLYSN